MNVRLANKDDFKGVLNLFKQVHQLHVTNRPDIFKDGDPITLEDFINDLDKGVMFIIAEDDGMITGFVQCEIVERETNLSRRSKVMHLSAGAVDENFRRRGIMSLLIDEVKSFAEENECDNIQLSVWAFNEVGRMTWESFGFEPLNTRMLLKVK